MPRFSALILMLGITMVLVGCAAQRATHAPAAGEIQDRNTVVQDEGFDPLSLQEDDLMVLPKPDLQPALPDGEKAPTAVSSKHRIREDNGFRVQISTTSLEVEARDVEQRAIVDFNTSVYLIFDPPNYKIRVGDCRTRAEANDLRLQAINLGYADAWVVQSRILYYENLPNGKNR
ncbi:MAG: SPOR domain-containing protein [bacterium]